MQIVIFLIVFGVIVTVHEFGHYWAAKKAGVLVREFAIGMGPKVFSTQRGETTYTLRLLPLGGYVRLAGRGDEVEPLKTGQRIAVVQDDAGVVTTINTSQQQLADAVPFEVISADLDKAMTLHGNMFDQEAITLQVSKAAQYIEENGTVIQVAPLERQLEQASVWKRMGINIAGPLSNMVLSIVVFMLVAFVSGGVNSHTSHVQVMESGAAQVAGLQTGDQIVSINGVATTSWRKLTDEIAKARESASDVVVVAKRGEAPEQTYNIALKDGYLGVTQLRLTDIQSKVLYGFTETWQQTLGIFDAITGLITGRVGMQQLGGPIAIAQVTGQAAQHGLLPVIWLTATLSVSIGVMNLVPIPVLDGGKILLNMIEVLRGKPISPEKETTITIIGAVFMLLLMVFVTYNDILNIFKG